MTLHPGASCNFVGALAGDYSEDPAGVGDLQLDLGVDRGARDRGHFAMKRVPGAGFHGETPQRWILQRLRTLARDARGDRRQPLLQAEERRDQAVALLGQDGSAAATSAGLCLQRRTGQ
jgi:hypothetical protein